jgi:hypothetical protein
MTAVTISRQQAKAITTQAIQDLAAARMEIPIYAAALEAIGRMLTTVLLSDSALISDERSIARLGRTMKDAARSLSLPIQIQSASEDLQRESLERALLELLRHGVTEDSPSAQRIIAEVEALSEKHQVGDLAITSIYTALVSAACTLLGEPLPAPAVQCEHPFDHVTQADLPRLNREALAR